LIDPSALRAAKADQLGKFGALRNPPKLLKARCHQNSNGAEIAPNVKWPPSKFFVHVDEQGNLSLALTKQFLPAISISVPQGAVVCNIGHFDNEIDTQYMRDNWTWDEVKPQVHRVFKSKDKNDYLILLSEGRLVNLGNATGNHQLGKNWILLIIPIYAKVST
jgi:hypothetical protein